MCFEERTRLYRCIRLLPRLSVSCQRYQHSQPSQAKPFDWFIIQLGTQLEFIYSQWSDWARYPPICPFFFFTQLRAKCLISPALISTSYSIFDAIKFNLYHTLMHCHGLAKHEEKSRNCSIRGDVNPFRRRINMQYLTLFLIDRFFKWQHRLFKGSDWPACNASNISLVVASHRFGTLPESANWSTHSFSVHMISNSL